MGKLLKNLLIKWLLRPGQKITRDRIGRHNIGPVMVVLTPVNWRQMSHDAVKAFHCGGYTYFFYDQVEEWNAFEFQKINNANAPQETR